LFLKLVLKPVFAVENLSEKMIKKASDEGTVR
jgi:hypothetical protein